MKTNQISTHKTSYQIVEEKLRVTNAYLKKVDMNQLYETVEQIRKKEVKSSQ
jgi:hypothetical protein